MSASPFLKLAKTPKDYRLNRREEFEYFANRN